LLNLGLTPDVFNRNLNQNLTWGNLVLIGEGVFLEFNLIYCQWKLIIKMKIF